MSGVLTDTDLAEIWDSAETELFSHTATIQRQGRVGKVSSGPFVEIDTDVPCLFIPPGGKLSVLLASMLSTGTIKQQGSERAWFAARRDVKTGDNLIRDNVRYSVGYIPPDPFGVWILADVERMRVEQT